jgi:hypothetical protein
MGRIQKIRNGTRSPIFHIEIGIKTNHIIKQRCSTKLGVSIIPNFLFSPKNLRITEFIIVFKID